MTKPIVVCGVDFSGTSMLAGMLHAAGIDMGDVESAEEIPVDRPVKYRTFEDRALRDWLAPLARVQMTNLPDITHAWLESLYTEFMDYKRWREAMARGAPWGVKCNGLLFLAMHPKFDELPVQWAVTDRDFRHSMLSLIQKLGNDPAKAALLGIQLSAIISLHLKAKDLEYDRRWVIDFLKTIENPWGVSAALASALGPSWNTCATIEKMASSVDPQTKGVIPCHGSSLPQPLAAHS